jgi:hypothetical protein
MVIPIEGRLQRSTFCELEADCHYTDLINYQDRNLVKLEDP